MPEHAHAAQWGVVLEGALDLTVNGVTTRYKKGIEHPVPPSAFPTPLSRLFPISMLSTLTRARAPL